MLGSCVHANSTQREQQEFSLLTPFFAPICDVKACVPQIPEKEALTSVSQSPRWCNERRA
jgi:hypothetical protein